MIITMKISSIIEPRRGEINATPLGLENHLNMHFYNPDTPSGFLKNIGLFLYNPNTPLGFLKNIGLFLYNPDTPSGLKS